MFAGLRCMAGVGQLASACTCAKVPALRVPCVSPFGQPVPAGWQVSLSRPAPKAEDGQPSSEQAQSFTMRIR